MTALRPPPREREGKTWPPRTFGITGQVADNEHDIKITENQWRAVGDIWGRQGEGVRETGTREAG